MDTLKLIVLGKGRYVIMPSLIIYFKQKFRCKCKSELCHCLFAYVDCAQEVTKYYGDEYIFDVSREADILEFASIHSKRNLKVVWSRSSVQTQERQVKISWFTAKIRDLTQVDSGYYNLRKKDNTLLWRRLLTVKGDKGEFSVVSVYSRVKHSHKLFIFSL